MYPCNVENIDFTKCLGKQKNDEDLTEPISTNEANGSLSYTKFVDIIGEEKVDQLKMYVQENITPVGEDTHCLLKLMKEFQKTCPVETHSVDTIETVSESNLDLHDKDENETMDAINLEMDNSYYTNENEDTDNLTYTDNQIMNMPVVICSNQDEKQTVLT